MFGGAKFTACQTWFTIAGILILSVLITTKNQSNISDLIKKSHEWMHSGVHDIKGSSCIGHCWHKTIRKSLHINTLAHINASKGWKVHWFTCTTRNYSFGFIVAINEEAKARKLRSLINAISRRCWGLKKSIWQFVKMQEPVSAVQVCPVSNAHYQKSKNRQPEGRDVDDSSQEPHFGNYNLFYAPVSLLFFFSNNWLAVAWKVITNLTLNKWPNVI